MKRWMVLLITGFVVGVVFLPLCGYLYFRYGFAPVATAESPIPFEKRLAHMALEARIRKEAPKNAAIQPTPDNLIAGAQIYRSQCAVCHGLPAQIMTPTAKGMFPKPPQLFEGHGVTDDPPGETYWKVSNGIRLTGMPAYGTSLTTQQMWQVSLMLAGADKLPEQVTAELRKPLAVNQ